MSAGTITYHFVTVISIETGHGIALGTKRHHEICFKSSQLASCCSRDVYLSESFLWPVFPTTSAPQAFVVTTHGMGESRFWPE